MATYKITEENRYKRVDKVRDIKNDGIVSNFSQDIAVNMRLFKDCEKNIKRALEKQYELDTNSLDKTDDKELKNMVAELLSTNLKYALDMGINYPSIENYSNILGEDSKELQDMFDSLAYLVVTDYKETRQSFDSIIQYYLGDLIFLTGQPSGTINHFLKFNNIK